MSVGVSTVSLIIAKSLRVFIFQLILSKEKFVLSLGNFVVATFETSKEAHCYNQIHEKLL